MHPSSEISTIKFKGWYQWTNIHSNLQKNHDRKRDIRVIQVIWGINNENNSAIWVLAFDMGEANLYPVN